MKRFKFFKIGIFILSSLLIVSIALAGGLPDEWTEIDPLYEYPGFEFNRLTPACSGFGSPYIDDKFTFFVKGGQKNNLVIFFQGGGACWDFNNCIKDATYQPYQYEKLGMFSDDMEGQGIFDQTRKDNPFKDWGFVYIPYCTGDLHMGANDAKYEGDLTWTIQHRGFVNFQTVLKYIEDNTNYPGKIFVTGSSAGSYGATINFPYVKESFPWSNVYLLGDAGNGVLGGNFPTVGISNWNVQMPDWIFPGGWGEDLPKTWYSDIAAEYPWSRLAQYTTALDLTQIFFLNVMYNIDYPGQWENITNELILEWNYNMLTYAYSTAAASPNYRYYIAAGTDHTVLRSNKFYTEESAVGVSFVGWVKKMINTPNKWENLECEGVDCY